jgi:hypothetical protein
MSTPLRFEKAALAASRAVEEQAERTADVRAVSGGGRKKKAAMASEADYEGYGRMLTKHLSSMNGGAYHKAFMRGCGIETFSGPVEAPAYGNPDVPDAGKFSSNVPQKARATPAILKKGAGPLKIEIDHDMGMEEEHGGYASGRYQGEGTGAGKPDKRKARGALLKKVMTEHGLNMAQASKYIKEHSLSY